MEWVCLRFPKILSLGKKWVNFISKYRIKGGNDSFIINNKTLICEFHFKIEEIKISLMSRKKQLVEGLTGSYHPLVYIKIKKLYPGQQRLKPP